MQRVTGQIKCEVDFAMQQPCREPQIGLLRINSRSVVFQFLKPVDNCILDSLCTELGMTNALIGTVKIDSQGPRGIHLLLPGKTPDALIETIRIAIELIQRHQHPPSQTRPEADTVGAIKLTGKTDSRSGSFQILDTDQPEFIE